MQAEALESAPAVQPRAVLAIYAHPDDEVLCAAGTLALCRRRGRNVALVCATRGEFGPIASETLATRQTLGSVREAELRASCAELGVESIHWLDLPDSGVSWAAPLRGAAASVARLIRELQPSAILSF